MQIGEKTKNTVKVKKILTNMTQMMTNPMELQSYLLDEIKATAFIEKLAKIVQDEE